MITHRPDILSQTEVSHMCSLQMWGHLAAIQKKVSLGVLTWKEVHDWLLRKEQVSMVWPHFYFLEKL